MAVTVTNLSRATGISTSTVKAYGDAIAASGGDFRGGVEDLTDLTKAIDDARKGNSDAQISFAELGIGLRDLSVLSEEDIFKKTISGLASIQDASKRTTMSMALLGGEFKKVDIQSISNSMNNAGSGGANVSAIKAASDAQKAIADNMNKLQSAILNLLEPLNKLVAGIQISTTVFEGLIKTLLAIGAAFLFFTKVLGPAKVAVAALEGLVPKVTVAFMSLGVALSTSPWRSLGAAIGTLLNPIQLLITTLGGPLMTASKMLWIMIKRIGLLVVAIATWNNVAGHFTTTMAVISGGIIKVIAMIAKFAVRFLGVVGIIMAVIQAIDFLTETFFKFSVIDWVMAKITPLWEMLKNIIGITNKTPKGTQADVRKVDNKIAEDNPEIFKMPKKEDDKGKTVIDAQRGIRVELQKTLAAYQDQNAELSRTMGFQNQIIGLDDDAINRKQKLFDLETNYLGQIKALKDQYVAMRDAAANGTEEEKNAFSAFASQYASFAGKITAEYDRQKVQVNDLISAEEVLKDREKQKLVVIEAITKQMERQAALGDILRGINDKTVDIKFEASLKGLDPYKAEIARINEEARKGALEAGRSFADQFASDDPLGLTPEDTMSLANGLELIAQKYKAISVQQIKQLDESRTWKSGWDEAFEAYADSATNAANMARDAFSSFSNGMDKLIDTFVTTGKFAFGDFAKSVIADLIKIELKAQAMSALKMLTGGNGIGGAMSTIGSFFGGFFAEGGQPPLGKASIVGEKGPELFVPKSAGTIIPNGGFGGAVSQSQPIINNNTYVTNNVSAVDAKSVAQLFQENRKQLFGVIETARKEMPGRTR
jgi:hypothetical protein